MILLDANLLLYAHNEGATEHAAARPWFEQSLSGTDRVGVPWPSILAFIRIASTRSSFASRFPQPRPGGWSGNGFGETTCGCQLLAPPTPTFWSLCSMRA